MPDVVEHAAMDLAKLTAIVVMGNEGANPADVLAPYEVLVPTGAFNAYTAAPERRPVPLTRGLDLVPDLTLAELDRRLPKGPDVILVPELPDAGGDYGGAAAAVADSQPCDNDNLLVSVCTGAEVLTSSSPAPTPRAVTRRPGMSS